MGSGELRERLLGWMPILMLAAVVAGVKDVDRHRALSTKTSERLGGRDAGEISWKINRALAAEGTPLVECRAQSLEELDELIALLRDHADERLDAMYAESDGRKLRGASRAAARTEAAAVALRDARCAHALMLWAHHLTADARRELVHERDVSLPTLPEYDERFAAALGSDAYRKHGFTFQAASTNGALFSFRVSSLETPLSG